MLRKYLTRVRNVTWNRRFFTATTRREPGDHGSAHENEAIQLDEEFVEGNHDNLGVQGEEAPDKNEVMTDLEQPAETETKLDQAEAVDKAEAHIEEEAHGQDRTNETLDEVKASKYKKNETWSTSEESETDESTEDLSEEASSVRTNDSDEASDDGLFGLCPPEAESDDFICILYGCSVPVVLRHEKDEETAEQYYKLVGEAYVHGKMEGEAMSDLEDRVTWGLTETFELR